MECSPCSGAKFSSDGARVDDATEDLVRLDDRASNAPMLQSAKVLDRVPTTGNGHGKMRPIGDIIEKSQIAWQHRAIDVR